ncbi:hypothetical protein FKR81_15285 [Lentzea tibetensis]|uniref:Uncharacterized protein n=1 Tax=Lentzea tibetensis TaxID=2591470 RepID=A0A563EV61_9PSEU|nr:hypothetical protein [Lentzea tibetensis]TWP51556.1 hypothetical protein FKR81_15285 [Lentzea tibetensis]
MAAKDEKTANCERKLLEDFATYDQHVDVVSAFEWMFTDPNVKSLPSTVKHFERFPKIKVSNTLTLTPDFTVLFADNTAIVGEIAKFATHENSVDKLCKQLANYDTLPGIPAGAGKLAKASHADVMQIVSMRLGPQAVQRIIIDRLRNPDHPYKPSHAPVIVQYAREDQTYMFQRVLRKENGSLHCNERQPNIGDYLDEGLNISASRFVKIKSARALINDQADRLYLATHLWAKTWPTAYGVGTSDISINPADTAVLLRKHHGVGTANDVRRALELLESAGLAAKEPEGRWLISRKLLGRSGKREVHSIIARRACQPDAPKTVSAKRRRSRHTTLGQGSLFELPFEPEPEPEPILELPSKPILAIEGPSREASE